MSDQLLTAPAPPVVPPPAPAAPAAAPAPVTASAESTPPPTTPVSTEVPSADVSQVASPLTKLGITNVSAFKDTPVAPLLEELAAYPRYLDVLADPKLVMDALDAREKLMAMDLALDQNPVEYFRAVLFDQNKQPYPEIADALPALVSELPPATRQKLAAALMLDTQAFAPDLMQGIERRVLQESLVREYDTFLQTRPRLDLLNTLQSSYEALVQAGKEQEALTVRTKLNELADPVLAQAGTLAMLAKKLGLQYTVQDFINQDKLKIEFPQPGAETKTTAADMQVARQHPELVQGFQAEASKTLVEIVDAMVERHLPNYPEAGRQAFAARFYEQLRDGLNATPAANIPGLIQEWTLSSLRNQPTQRAITRLKAHAQELANRAWPEFAKQALPGMAPGAPPAPGQRVSSALLTLEQIGPEPQRTKFNSAGEWAVAWAQWQEKMSAHHASHS